MHQTLYRKYRPINFDDVYGQNVIVKILKNQIENNSIAHAYIFSGPRGTGKTSVAKIFAKTVNCLSTGVKPCNQCVNCTQTIEGDSLDIVEIDAASNNGIDEIRELKSKVSLVPTSGKYKVYIIDEVHMLTTAAFNALLKTLEEPPAHIIFILATTEQHKIPETILSRCQKFDFKRISENELFNRLKEIAQLENINIEDNAIKEIARLSEGGMRDSIGTLELVSSYQTNKIEVSDVHEISGIISVNEIKEIIELLLSSQTKLILEKIDQYYNSGKNLVKILDEILIFLKNCLVTYNIPDYFEENSKYLQINEKLKYKTNLDIINFIFKNLQEIKKYNNAKVMIEILFINLVNNYGSTVIPVENELDKLETPKTEIFKEEKHVDTLVENEEKQIQAPVKKEEKQIITEVTEEKTYKVDAKLDSDDYENLLKRSRVDNAFSTVSKTKLAQFKETLDNIEVSSLNADDKRLYHYLVDGDIKVVGDKNFIVVFETQTLKNYFNKELVNIEEFIRNTLKRDYMGFALDLNEWEFYRTEFKNKTREYTYKDDQTVFLKYISSIPKTKNTIESIFSDLIQVR